MRRERIAWCLFDFANSAFNTIVITFVYAVFFKQALVGDDARGDTLWGASLTTAGIAIAILAPVFGAMADRGGHRRRFLITSSLVTIGCTALLFFPHGNGAESAIWTAFCLVTIANVGFEIAFVFYNSFLPQLGDAKTVGRLSGYGWALGYVGGLGCLVLSLGFVGAAGLGPWLPETDGLNVRATNLLVAVWFLVFAVPMFVWVRDSGEATGEPGGLRAALATLRSLRDAPDLLRFFIARLFYNDGLMAIIGLAALYMNETLGMEVGDIMIVAIWLNVAAGIGAFGFGFIDDRVGARVTVIASLVLLITGTSLAFLVPTVSMFWVAATLIGVGMGPNQSASRTLLARMIQPARSAEFYGLFALSGKATVWLGPLLFTLVRPHVDDQRIAFLPVVLLMVVGFVLVLGVDEKRGIALAHRD